MLARHFATSKLERLRHGCVKEASMHMSRDAIQLWYLAKSLDVVDGNIVLSHLVMAYITTKNGSRQLMFLITTGTLLLFSTITVLLRYAGVLVLQSADTSHTDSYVDFTVASSTFAMSVWMTTSWSLLLLSQLAWAL